MSISPDRILFEDAHVLAVNKLCSELTVRGKGKVVKLPLFDFLKKDYPGLRAIHRLDFETSGVVLFAKNAEVEGKILPADRSAKREGSNKKFDQSASSIPDHASRWKKTYRTLVMGRILRNGGAIRTKLPARTAGEVDAQTLYTVLDRFANSTYLECEITTGRHHQIRRHFASIDHPLVLDRVYGHGKFNQLFRQELGFGTFFLHASKLTFPHPVTGKIMVIEAPMPKAFVACLAKLRALS